MIRRIFAAITISAGCATPAPPPAIIPAAILPPSEKPALPVDPVSLEALLLSAVTSVAMQRGQLVVFDPALQRAATAYLDVTRNLADDAELIPADVFDLVALAGAPEHVPSVWVGTNLQAHDITPDLSRRVLGFDVEPRAPVVAAGLASDGRRIVVIAAARWATLEEQIPSRAHRGTRIRVRGQLSRGVSKPQLALAPPAMAVRTTPLGDGPTFDTEVVLDRPGVWRIEITASTSRFGPRPVINVPVFVDVEPPPAGVGPGRFGGSAQEAEGRMHALIDDTRRERGLPPLLPDATLDAVARAHCADMTANGFIAHVSPTTGTPTDRVRQAGLRVPLVGENLATAGHPDDAHLGLIHSPGHLAVMTAAEWTHVGVGVGPSADGDLCFDEVYVMEPKPIDLGEARARLIAEVTKERLKRGAGRCRWDKPLGDFAARLADRFFSKPDVFADPVHTEAALFGRIPFANVQIQRFTRHAAPDATAFDTLLDPATEACALALGQGTSAEGIPNTIGVVALRATDAAPDLSTPEARDAYRVKVLATLNGVRSDAGLAMFSADGPLDKAADDGLRGPVETAGGRAFKLVQVRQIHAGEALESSAFQDVAPHLPDRVPDTIRARLKGGLKGVGIGLAGVVTDRGVTEAAVLLLFRPE